MTYANIPAEMRAYHQWIVWRYEDTDGPKPTKVPYDPKTGQLASSTDPATWATYETAVAAAESPYYAGLGFVLSQHDPYTFIDLDDTEGDNDKAARQVRIFQEFNSYSEVSPSGKGLHIIIRGAIGAGRKRDKIELYSNKRFMTMTGNVYHPVAIAERQELLTVLYNEMGGGSSVLNYSVDRPQTETDADILAKAANAENGEKFLTLQQGRWNELYASQSEADQAYINIIAFYTQNHDQIIRIFLASPLGQRDKAKREEYIRWTMNKAFDRMLPPLDFDGLRNEIEARLADKQALEAALHAPAAVYEPGTNGAGPIPPAPATAPMPQQPAPYLRNGATSFPPGLVGEIADFILKAAPRPVPEIALVGALGLMAGMTGKAYNVSRTGLNQYFLLLAETGKGKEAIASGISRLTDAVRTSCPSIKDFIGPGLINSEQSLIKYLSSKSSSFVSIVGEYGVYMRQMAAHNANANQVGLMRAILDLYNKSGEGAAYQPMIYADSQKNTDVVVAPAFSMVGESVPESFYSNLDESMISSGLLPRFAIFEYNGPRPPLSPTAASAQPSYELVQRMTALASNCQTLVHTGKAVHVQLDATSQQLADAFDKECDAAINNPNGNEVTRQLWNRAHVKSLKLSALVAVGINPYQPIITPDVYDWARQIVMYDTLNILGRFERGDVGADNEEARQIADVVKVCVEYVTKPFAEVDQYALNPAMHNDRVIPYAFIQRKLVARASMRKDKFGATNAIKRTIQSLLDAGDLREVGRNDLATRYGSSAKAYMIANPRRFVS